MLGDGQVYCAGCLRPFTSGKYLNQHQRKTGHCGEADGPVVEDEWEADKRQAVEDTGPLEVDSEDAQEMPQSTVPAEGEAPSRGPGEYSRSGHSKLCLVAC